MLLVIYLLHINYVDSKDIMEIEDVPNVSGSSVDRSQTKIILDLIVKIGQQETLENIAKFQSKLKQQVLEVKLKQVWDILFTSF